MKSYTVVITLPDLPAAHAEWTCNVNASSLHVAISRALVSLKQERHVKGRQISRAIIVATVNRPEQGGKERVCARRSTG